MPSSESVRIDKWLWAVRVYKSRSIASEACKNGKVLLNGDTVKPSRNIIVGDVIMIRRNPIIVSYKVKGLLSKRQSAKIVSDYFDDITSEDELLKLETIKYMSFERRDKGAGRPTKKERRILNKLKD